MSFRARLAAVVTAASALVLLAGCTTATPSLDTLSSVTFSQSQAVADFDSAEYTQTDPAELKAFADLMREFDIDPATYTPADAAGCAGGVTSTVELAFGDDTRTLTIDGCAADDRTFEQGATDLLTGWREELSAVL